MSEQQAVEDAVAELLTYTDGWIADAREDFRQAVAVLVLAADARGRAAEKAAQARARDHFKTSEYEDPQ